MELFVFAGADNNFTLYEDAGDYSDYKNGAFVNTQIEHVWSENASIKIHAAKGEVSLIPEKRNWIVKFRGIKKPAAVKVVVAGREQEIAFEYDELCATTTVVLKDIAVQSDVEIFFACEGNLLYNNSGARNHILEMLIHSQMAYHTKTVIWEHLHKKSKGMFMVCGEPEHQAVLGFIEEMKALET